MKNRGNHKNQYIAFIALMGIIAWAGQTAEAAMETKTNGGTDVIQPFNYTGVQLLPGRQKAQFDQVRDFFMGLHPNDILRGFRLRHASWAPGKELGGAYSQNALCFGQWLGGLARVYKATGDIAVRDRAVYLMNEWGKTIDDDGFFGYREGQAGHYMYEKMVGGLVDIAEYIDPKDALVHLDRITSWAEKNLDRENPFALPTEWYTLSENLYRAYELSGDQRYYDFAKVWEYTDYWDAFANEQDVFGVLTKAEKHRSYHAYSHVNALSGAAMAYRVTGEEKYLDTIVNAYRFLQETQLFATGGYGPEESFIVPNGMPETLLGIRRGEANVDVRFHFETTCGSWAGFKLGRYLMSFTGEARYGDWIERLVYNGVGALIPMNDYGMTMYGSSYNTHGAQKSLSTVWFCCQGSLLQTVTDYHNLIYFHDPKNLYVNLYVPSRVDWNGPDGNVRVVQEHLFPESDTVNLHIESRKPSRFGLKLRIPLWADAGVKAAINGEDFDLVATPGSWAVIEREWAPGDCVTLRFDLSLRAEPAPGCISPMAVLCGPVVMVEATARTPLPSQGPLRYPADWLELSGTARINPHRQLHSNQELRPFYDMGSGEFYRMYFERPGKKEIGTDALTFHGSWETRESGRYSVEPESHFEGEFKGSTLVWEGRRHKDAGIAVVTIDGKEVAEVDQYVYEDVHVGRMDQRNVPFQWSISGLGNGLHTLRITVTGRQNPSAAAAAINVSGLSSYP